MKATAYQQTGDTSVLTDITLDKPSPSGHDILVKVEAISVNPVDAKVRSTLTPQADAEWQVLGYDASGTIEAIGEEVEDYQVGDHVYYAGAIDRPGTNSEYHLVDHRIVGPKPESLSHAEAAALPLTTITAYEMLFDRLKVEDPTPQGHDTILVIGGAGGVGSMTIQLLAALTDHTIIATASREETQAWCKELGAHHVITHREPMAAQLKELDVPAPGYVFCTTHTDSHIEDIAKLIAPQGRLGIIDDPGQLDISLIKQKAISLHWEFMFTRPLFTTPDITRQRQLLTQVAELIDQEKIKTTLTETYGTINAANLTKAHQLIESHRAKGKIVLQGFDS